MCSSITKLILSFTPETLHASNLLLTLLSQYIQNINKNIQRSFLIKHKKQEISNLHTRFGQATQTKYQSEFDYQRYPVILMPTNLSETYKSPRFGMTDDDSDPWTKQDPRIKNDQRKPSTKNEPELNPPTKHTS